MLFFILHFCLFNRNKGIEGMFNMNEKKPLKTSERVLTLITFNYMIHLLIK